MRVAAKMGLLGSLYLSQGLPFGFFTQALPVLLRKQGLSLGEIGLTSLLALPWALKFLWAPLVDRYGLPGIGRRRSWILPIQALTAGVLAVVAASPPSESIRPLLATVFIVNLLAATQDIATDGLAVDLLARRERGLANGVQVAGYRVGMIIGGGALLLVTERLGWGRTFLSMAGLLLLATVPILATRERAPAPLQALPGEVGGAGGAAPTVLGSLATRPHFLKRPGARRLIALVLVYKVGDAFATGMLRPFLADLGLTLADIGLLLGTVGFVAGLLGALAGGALVERLGRGRSLVLFGILQAATIGGYVAAAVGFRPMAFLYAVCAAEHFASGMATAALFTFMMDRTEPETAATDYTVQASAVVIATGAASTLSGASAQVLGYALHFGVATGLSFVTTVVAARLFRQVARADARAVSAVRADRA